MTSPDLQKHKLHYCAFHGLASKLEEELKQISKDADIDEVDTYGNTALHLAVMKGHKDCAALLMAAGCSVLVANTDGWTALSEAISYGSQSLVADIYLHLRNEIFCQQKVKYYSERLANVPNCQVDFRWEIVSWMPFIKNALPSDECCLRKIGSCLRLDTHLVDLFGFKSSQGKLSLIFNQNNQYPMVLLNHSESVYYSIGGGDVSVLSDVVVLRGTKLVNDRLIMEKTSLKPSKRGHRRPDKSKNNGSTTQLGKFTVNYYTLSHLTLRTVKRYEHLSDYYRSKRKSLSERIRRKSSTAETIRKNAEDTSDLTPIGQSLEMPPESTSQVTWEEYISGSLKATQRYLGRKPEVKCHDKRLRLYVAMTTESPLKVTHLNEIIRVLSPIESFQRLHELLEDKMPPGFPIYIEVPIYPTVVMKFLCEDVLILPDDYSCVPSVSGSLFTVPPTYKYAGEFKLKTDKKAQRRR